MIKFGVNSSIRNFGETLKNVAADLLDNSDFISRTIGMDNSYEDIMFLVQLLGREPVSLLGKDYPYIYDHVRRNYLQGTEIPSKGGHSLDNGYNCPKFTFYKDLPTIRFANPYDDPMNFNGVIEINESLFQSNIDGSTEMFYSEHHDLEVTSANTGVAHESVKSFPISVDTCDIIKKTNDNFRNGKYKTLIARFHTDSEDSKSQTDTTQTSVSKTFGMSHGRNLLKLKEDKTNGYSNPYCRVWTYHHQYHRMQDAIRPFGEAYSADELEGHEFSHLYGQGGFRTIGGSDFEGGSVRLDKHGVLNYKNNMVTIAPTAKIKDYFEHKEDDSDRQTFSTKRCMFSIENLAWKDRKINKDEYDENGLSPEQKGPLGGRIMWFPPYDLQFNENVTTHWNPNEFIGRGENIYTYRNTERSGNLSFTLLIDHPSIVNYWAKDKLLPKNTNGVDGVNNQEQTLLRFFAGCEILSAKPQEYSIRNVEPLNVDEEGKKDGDNPPDTDVMEKTQHKMRCILYYPNNYSGKYDDAEFAVNYLMNGKGTQKIIRKNDNGYYLEDIPPLSVFNSGVGYEFGDEGISIKTWDEIKDDINFGVLPNESTIDNTIVESAENNIGSEGDWAKIVGNLADKSLTSDSTKATSEWKMRRWYYRVDEDSDVVNQRLEGKPNNYIDGKSYRLNTDGYNLVRENKIFNFDEKEELVSFIDLYVALTNIETFGTKTIPFDSDMVEKIRKIKNGENGYKIKSVSFEGHNSSHGRNKKENTNIKRNSTLSSSRALTFKKWMIKQGFPMAENAQEKTLSQSDQVNKYKTEDVDNLYIKAWRSASVIIEYEKEEKVNAAIAEQAEVKTDIKNKETSKNPLMSTYEYISNNKEIYDALEKVNKDFGINDDSKYSEIGVSEVKDTVKRYDNEGEFFESLERDAPFLHNLIVDKIKYFDPAFHSISPEGFNARLTFLHQCTRQGSTVENNSSVDGSTSYNLAFGRPPVCVLRIGDFYYTKIIIESLSIQYDTPQWDLNPEGIGVMPMFAKINMNFKFLGGSDLGGPIARLQNAVSFNYYANTSVYDNRAEMVEYKNDGSGDEVNFKGWNYPNSNTKRDK